MIITTKFIYPVIKFDASGNQYKAVVVESTESKLTIDDIISYNTGQELEKKG
jgi:hypothetical protein